jgi:hypothetical protein
MYGYQMNRNSKIILAAVIALSAIPALLYLLNFGNLAFSKNISEWAQFGDYIGGVTNPVLSLITFLAVLYSIHQNGIALKQNSIELKLSREEFRKSADAHSEIARYELKKIEMEALSNERNEYREGTRRAYKIFQKSITGLILIKNNKSISLSNVDINFLQREGVIFENKIDKQLKWNMN